MSATLRRVAVVDVIVERRNIGENMLDIIKSVPQKITSLIPFIKNLSEITESGVYKCSIQTVILQKAIINFLAESYQRMFKASKKWQKNFIRTIFEEKYTIPAFTFRTSDEVLSGNFFAECMDGLQRSITILLFHSGLIRLPSRVISRGIDVGGMTGPEIARRYPDLYQEVFLNHPLTWVVYHNICDDDAKHIFTVILNNANALNSQEKRNATNSALADLIRRMSRLETKLRHEIFQFVERSNSGIINYIPKYLGFQPSNMKYDETLARIFCYAEARLKNSSSFAIDLGNTALNKMYENPEYKQVVDEKLVSSVIKTLDKTLHAIKCGDPTFLKNKKKYYSTPNFLMLTRMIFEIYNMNHGKIADNSLFMTKFHDKYKSLCRLSKEERAKGHKKTSYARAVTKMEPEFVKDATLAILKNILREPKSWGVVLRDSARDFTHEIKLAAYSRQNGKCYITGEKLEFDQGHAAHILAWSDGGKTTLENCAFICKEINEKMGTLSVRDFKEFYESRLN